MKKNLDEAVNSGYTIEDLERLLKIDKENGYELGIIAQPKDESTPFAWDAGLEVKDGMIHIDGYFMPGGPEAGTVNIRCKFDSFKRHMDLRCDIHALDELNISDEDKDFVRRICDSY